MKKAPRNIHIQIFVYVNVNFSWIKTVFQHVHTTLYSYQQCSASLVITGIVLSFAILINVLWYLTVVLICIFLYL